jgi:hypothetical protein
MVLALALALACGSAVRAETFYSSSDMPAPGGMEVEWQSVASGAGTVVKAWVRDDLIIVETDSHNLIAIRRTDGYHLWQCFLENSIRFTPAISRTNILINVNNFLLAIDKRSGNIRWKLGTDFIMSTDPLLVDPPLYPREYAKEWQNLETIVLAGWDSRIHCYWSRGRLSTLIKGIRPGEDVIAPNFDLFKQWLKANKSGAFTLMPMRLRDEVIYYTADNGLINAVNLNGDEQEPYYMMGNACTELTVTSTSIFVGARDSYVYCLDRLLMKKKWTFAPGKLARGTIFADSLQARAQRRFRNARTLHRIVDHQGRRHRHCRPEICLHRQRKNRRPCLQKRLGSGKRNGQSRLDRHFRRHVSGIPEQLEQPEFRRAHLRRLARRPRHQL